MNLLALKFAEHFQTMCSVDAPFCYKITIGVYSKLPAILIKIRYGLGESVRKTISVAEFLDTPDCKLWLAF